MNQQQNTKPTTEMAQQMVEFPMDQAIEYQSNLGRLMLSGLTMSDWAQSQGVEMTRRTIDTYLRTLQNATEQISQSSAAVAASTAQQAEQGMRELERGQTPRAQGAHHGAPQPQQQYRQSGQQIPPQESTSFQGSPQPVPQNQQQPQPVPQNQQQPQQVPQEHQYQPEHQYQQEPWVTAPAETGTDRRQESSQQAEDPPVQPQR